MLCNQMIHFNLACFLFYFLFCVSAIQYIFPSLITTCSVLMIIILLSIVANDRTILLSYFEVSTIRNFHLPTVDALLSKLLRLSTY
jgi:hypothetical protein